MSEKDDGGRAFPALESLSKDRFDNYDARSEGGMTLRDYFAAKAMQGLIAHVDLDYTMGKAAVDAYLMADRMIAAKGKA